MFTQGESHHLVAMEAAARGAKGELHPGGLLRRLYRFDIQAADCGGSPARSYLLWSLTTRVRVRAQFGVDFSPSLLGNAFRDP